MCVHRQDHQWQAVRSLPTEAPALPLPAVATFLRALLAEGGDAASAALVVVREAGYL